MAWKNWGDHPVVVTVGVLAGLAGIIAFGYTIFTSPGMQQLTQGNDIPDINAPNGNVQVGNNNSFTNNKNVTINQTEASRLPPPDVSAPTLTANELFSMELGTQSGCYPEGSSHVMTLAKAGQDDLYSGSEPPHFYLIDERGVQEKIYLDTDISNATARACYALLRFASLGVWIEKHTQPM